MSFRTIGQYIGSGTMDAPPHPAYTGNVRLGWVTDVHLNFVPAPRRARFYADLVRHQLDGLLIGGDIAEAPSVEGFLRELDDALNIPLYFVLGNHDFYFGSIRGVREAVGRLAEHSPRLHYLTASGMLELTPATALIGHDGWADGRLGDFFGSSVLLNDYFLIEELNTLDPAGRYARLNQLGDEAADSLEFELRHALITHRRVIALTHVPPYRDACWHEGRISGSEWLPHFSSRAVGERLSAVMAGHPESQLTVLCGHTHGGGRALIGSNVTVHTGGASYGCPELQFVLEVD